MLAHASDVMTKVSDHFMANLFVLFLVFERMNLSRIVILNWTVANGAG
jgi:hypothetical protein